MPSPKFFVLYDGSSPEPLQRKLKLSDAFNDGNPSLELVVTSFNINTGMNQPLLQQCRELNDYSTLIGKVKQGQAIGLSRRDAIIDAVNWCIDNGVVSEYLSAKRNEVFTMLDLQWNLDDAKAAWKEEGREEGLEKGIEQGKNQRSEEIALKLIHMGLTVQNIADVTTLSPKRVQELANLNQMKC